MSDVTLDFDQIFGELKDFDAMLQDARTALLAPDTFPAFNLIPAAHLGIEILGDDPSNDLLVKAKYPEGWHKRPVDSVPATPPFVGIYDEQGRERSRIFFNCDDPAKVTYHVVVLRRYGYRLETRGGLMPFRQVVILDSGKEIDRVAIKPGTTPVADEEARKIMRERFPHWTNVRAYW